LVSLVIRVHDIRKSFGSIKAVDGVQFEVHRGEVFGLLGPNGAGKSTVIAMCTGQIPPDSGSIDIGDIGSPRAARARALIGLAPQQIALYQELTARENLVFLSRVHGIPDPVRRADELQDMVGLLPRALDRVGTFSGGMQRRLNLAAALVHNPMALFLDEPTAGVDPQSRTAILEVVLRLASEGRAVIYTTHYMEEAQRLCSRVAIMDRGRVLAIGTVPELVREYGGDSVVTVDSLVGERQVRTREPLREIERALAEGGATAVRIEQPDLEMVFLSLTGRRLRD
jgi:ABC-2 type transport system ATP-binding protein